MSDVKKTTQDIRHEATAYWSEDIIPSQHPARKKAEVKFDQWLAEHDATTKAEAKAPFRAVLAGMDNLIEHSAVLRSDFEGAADALRKALEEE